MRISLQEAKIGEQDISADRCLPPPTPASKQRALGGGGDGVGGWVMSTSKLLVTQWASQMGKCLLWPRTAMFSASGATGWLQWTLSGCSSLDLQVPCLSPSSQHPERSKEVKTVWGSWQELKVSEECRGCWVRHRVHKTSFKASELLLFSSW